MFYFRGRKHGNVFSSCIHARSSSYARHASKYGCNGFPKYAPTRFYAYATSKCFDSSDVFCKLCKPGTSFKFKIKYFIYVLNKYEHGKNCLSLAIHCGLFRGIIWLKLKFSIIKFYCISYS